MQNKNEIIKIEKQLLGLLIRNPSLFSNIKGLIEAKAFNEYKHQMIFNSMMNISEQGAEMDIALILNNLKKEKVKNVDELFIGDLIDNRGYKTNITNYVKEISDFFEMTEIQSAMNEFAREIKSRKNLNPTEVVSEIQQKLIEVTKSRNVKNLTHIKDVVEETLKKIDYRIKNPGLTGIASEFIELDQKTSGFQKGDLIILAARPSMGKTALSLNFAVNAAVAKKTVVIFSLEMSNEQLTERILSQVSLVPLDKIKNAHKLVPQEMKKIYNAYDKIKNFNLIMDDTSGISIDELEWKLKRWTENREVDLVIIDYLQLLTLKNRNGENRQNEVSYISRVLKKIARDLNVPIIALAQLSRKVESRENKRPIMSDIRDSGSIEQDADLIMFLYREFYYKQKENSDDEVIDKSAPAPAEVIIQKHRNGEIGTVELVFNPKLGLFINGEQKV